MSIYAPEPIHTGRRRRPLTPRAVPAVASVLPLGYVHDETIGRLTLHLLEGRSNEVIAATNRLIVTLEKLDRAAEVRDLQILRTLAELDLGLGAAGSHIPAAKIALRFALRIVPTLTQLVGPSTGPLPCDPHCERLLTERLRLDQTAPDLLLSKREIETLALTELGLSNKEIAARMSIEEGTVKKHQSNLMRKLDVRNRTQAVTRARQLGLLR